MSPLVVVAIALVLVGAIAFVLMRGGEGAKRAKGPAGAGSGDAGGVSVEGYRASYQRRLAAARQVVARRAAARAAAARDAGAGGSDRRDANAFLRTIWRSSMEPTCILGPGELCATLDETGTACDGGDAQACLALGQYLADTPPRPLIAISFFLAACRLGDEEGCRRMKEVKEPTDAPCTDDVFRCAWLAYKSRDAARLDEACAEGVADACAWLLTAHDGSDPAKARTYLEHACQLGSPMACEELGRRLMPGCQPEADAPCYAPDSAEAAEARAIACEAGFADACD